MTDEPTSDDTEPRAPSPRNSWETAKKVFFRPGFVVPVVLGLVLVAYWYGLFDPAETRAISRVYAKLQPLLEYERITAGLKEMEAIDISACPVEFQETYREAVGAVAEIDRIEARIFEAARWHKQAGRVAYTRKLDSEREKRSGQIKAAKQRFRQAAAKLDEIARSYDVQVK